MSEKVSPKIVSLAFGILVICFAMAFYVIAWQEPTEAPPGGNVPASINVGLEEQWKEGELGIGSALWNLPYGEMAASVFYDADDPTGNYFLNPAGPSSLESINLNDNRIVNLKDPANSSDAATKKYVDLRVGLWKDVNTYIYPQNAPGFKIHDDGKVEWQGKKFKEWKKVVVREDRTYHVTTAKEAKEKYGSDCVSCNTVCSVEGCSNCIQAWYDHWEDECSQGVCVNGLDLKCSCGDCLSEEYYVPSFE